MAKPDEHAESWGKMQVRWGFILADLPPVAVKQFISDIIDAEDFAIYTMLIALKFRFDCPEVVFEQLDDIAVLQARRAPGQEFDAWGEHARAALRAFIGDKPETIH
jgi:hypothetical protein